MTTLLPAIQAHHRSLPLPLDAHGYLPTVAANLLAPFPNWPEIESDLRSGDGGELEPTRYGPAKFQAAHSSAALCVNNFAPFKQHKGDVNFLGHSGFTEASFERQLSTGISTPNLDFYLCNGDATIGVESKFTELLKPKAPCSCNLAKYLDRSELAYLPDGYTALVAGYNARQDEVYLDAAQLLKHGMGLINNTRTLFGGYEKAQVTLVYIFWEPENWQDFDVYEQHRSEIAEFHEKLSPFLTFVPLPYREFWDMFAQVPLFRDHIAAMKQRYSFAV